MQWICIPSPRPICCHWIYCDTWSSLLSIMVQFATPLHFQSTYRDIRTALIPIMHIGPIRHTLTLPLKPLWHLEHAHTRFIYLAITPTLTFGSTQMLWKNSRWSMYEPHSNLYSGMFVARPFVLLTWLIRSKNMVQLNSTLSSTEEFEEAGNMSDDGARRVKVCRASPETFLSSGSIASTSEVAHRWCSNASTRSKSVSSELCKTSISPRFPPQLGERNLLQVGFRKLVEPLRRNNTGCVFKHVTVNYE